MNITRFIILSRTFRIPVAIVVGMIMYLLLAFFKLSVPATVIIFISIFLGSYELLRETFISLWNRQFALDYIAILAIVVSILTREYLVAAVLALMISSGRTLEAYGVSQAKRSLSELVDRIPREVLRWEDGSVSKKVKIEEAHIKQQILVRKGEVIPLDGVLVSKSAEIDESTLTGEPYPVDKIVGDQLRSGTINAGQPIVITITREEKDSTYKKIIRLVQSAQEEKSPFVRLADRYSTVFTLVALAISLFAYFYSHENLATVLAVLTVATPCPLIIATPIALLGGVNASAKRRIIVKKIASLEVLSRIRVLVFDKTGTITIGKPRVIRFEKISKEHTEQEILGIAQAIERNSLHPLAKAVVEFASRRRVKVLHAENIEEKIGSGISASINGKRFTLAKLPDKTGMASALSNGKRQIAVFYFEDEIKQESQEIIKKLSNRGLRLFVLTGDKKESAEKVVENLGSTITLQSELSPEQKLEEIKKLKKNKQVVAMIGDGINDAPALAAADVGLVFSNEEQTAASEAADIVLLGSSFGQVLDAYVISNRTIKIAMQSILWGIGLSIGAMVLASLGFIPPLFGAGLQEAIDVAVILNALRASR